MADTEPATAACPRCGGFDHELCSSDGRAVRMPTTTTTAAPAAHLVPWVWEYVGDLRDHLGRDHKRRAEMLVGLDRFALMDLHKELHGG